MNQSSVILLLVVGVSSLGVTAWQECASSGDCPQDKVCAANLCEDPCPGFCGENTVCQVKWHTPRCSCHQGYNGDPMRGCTEAALQECSFNGDCSLDKACEKHSCEDPCPGLCGNNTLCEVKSHIPVCSCRQGFTGEPMLGCTESAPECYSNDDCDQDRACYIDGCKDPCLNACGINAFCRVAKHIPVCKCHEGFIGDPLEGCTVPACIPVNPTNVTGKKQYEVSKLKLNWFEAFNHCQSRGMRMATFDTKDEFDELVTEITKSEAATHVWVGANDLGREGHFFWMSTGQPLQGYQKWEKENPDNEGVGEHCVLLWKDDGVYVMNDYFCSRENYFACEH